MYMGTLKTGVTLADRRPGEGGPVGLSAGGAQGADDAQQHVVADLAGSEQIANLVIGEGDGRGAAVGQSSSSGRWTHPARMSGRVGGR